MFRILYYSHMNPQRKETIEATLGKICLLSSVLASWYAGSTVDFDAIADLPSITPRPAAFGIWIVLYALLGYDASIGRIAASPRATALLTASLLSTVAWSTVTTAATKSASVLLLATVLAWLAASTPRSPSSAHLYVGWLTVASALAIARALPILDHPSTLSGVGLLVAVASKGRPLLRVGVVVAVLLQRTWSPWHVVSLTLTQLYPRER